MDNDRPSGLHSLLRMQMFVALVHLNGYCQLQLVTHLENSDWMVHRKESVWGLIFSLVGVVMWIAPAPAPPPPPPKTRKHCRGVNFVWKQFCPESRLCLCARVNLLREHFSKIFCFRIKFAGSLGIPWFRTGY